jgi:hypothetical protein
MDFGQRVLTTRHFSGLRTTANQGGEQGECGWGLSTTLNISDNLQLLKEASSQTTANIVIEPLAGRHLLQQLAVQYRPVICSKPSSSISTHQLISTIEQVKSLNIIVITDGVPSDDVESVIVRAAKRLDQCNAEPWQVGIQFFQVGEPHSS